MFAQSTLLSALSIVNAPAFVYVSSLLFFCAALHAAAEGGSAEVAQLLLENGANVNATDTSQCTPLHIAGKQYSTDDMTSC